jgi:two-component system, OmpR family, sensor histidine kinase VanS
MERKADVFQSALRGKPGRSLNIRGKLYLLIVSILVLNLLLTFFFGQTLLSRFYLLSKTRELKTFRAQIQTVFADDDKLSRIIGEAEKRNITALIFTMDEDQVSVVYFSRTTVPGAMMPRGNARDRLRYNPLLWITYAVNRQILEELADANTNDTIIQTHSDFSMHPGMAVTGPSMQLYSKINANTYLFLETPREYIEQTASFAVRYMLYISLGTLAVALILLAFAAKKITDPIRNMEKVADKIANLDFSEQCEVRNNDELGQLSDSINRMSKTLQENIGNLTVMNAMLQEDLVREEKTNQIRREFIANVSHDFKTPLSLISAYAEAVKDDLDRERHDGESSESMENEIKNRCDIIIAESAKMDKLVNQLLRLSLLENKMVRVDCAPFDLTGLIGEVIRKNQILLKSSKLTVRFQDTSERIGYGDYAKIEQVISNLFENAIKYARKETVIDVWVEREEKYTVRIFNETQRVDEIDPDLLFTSFYKGDFSRSLEDKSYGLGLAIVKAIVELHGNRCGAYRKDQGLVFWFEISVFPDDKEEPL